MTPSMVAGHDISCPYERNKEHAGDKARRYNCKGEETTQAGCRRYESGEVRRKSQNLKRR